MSSPSKNKSPKLSVVLATRNEAANLPRCLGAIASLAQEIIIADEESVDDTVKIAKSFKAKVISVPHQSNFHHTKNLAIDAATGDWVLQLDADEVVTPELGRELREKLIAWQRGEHQYSGYWVNRRNYFLGRFLTKGGQYPDPTLRFYRRGLGRLPAKDVHEQAVVQGRVGHLRHDLLHYRDTSFEKYLDGFNRYSSFIANQLLEQKIPLNLTNSLNYLVVKPLVTFSKIYLRHRGLVDGFPGFVFALFSGLIHPVAYLKLWQIRYYPAVEAAP